MMNRTLIAFALLVGSPVWAADSKPNASNTAKPAQNKAAPAKSTAAISAKTISAKTTPAKAMPDKAAIAKAMTAKPANTMAATPAKTNRPSTLAEASNAQQAAGQTNIIATVDNPLVTNIVPWQDQNASIPKGPLEFSALKDALTPTDRDRLSSEIRYTQILNQTSSRQ